MKIASTFLIAAVLLGCEGTTAPLDATVADVQDASDTTVSDSSDAGDAGSDASARGDSNPLLDMDTR